MIQSSINALGALQAQQQRAAAAAAQQAEMDRQRRNAERAAAEARIRAADERMRAATTNAFAPASLPAASAANPFAAPANPFAVPDSLPASTESSPAPMAPTIPAAVDANEIAVPQTCQAFIGRVQLNGPVLLLTPGDSLASARDRREVAPQTSILQDAIELVRIASQTPQAPPTAEERAQAREEQARALGSWCESYRNDNPGPPTFNEFTGYLINSGRATVSRPQGPTSHGVRG